MPLKYSPEFKARALQLIEVRIQAEQCSGWVACTAVGEALGGISPHTLRNWWKQNRIDQGLAPGVSSEGSEEMRRLRRENLELRRANEIRRKASAFFAAELDRPTTK
ncbi:transposase [Nesterenkonia xinjiangensis]|uniref:Transposase n=1 Tax=Nesterenkonia xinjiangensis TaxID=225327 RepID=A0A7Z0K866_9MICC|nr:transposase [Nesterenkonia xinjiangensis]